MVFSSIFFIFYFLPIFMIIYFLAPNKLKNIVLFIGSLFFYAWGEPTYLILLLFSSFFNYYMGIEISKKIDRRRNLIFAVVINLLILGYFKYFGWILDMIGGAFRIDIPHPELALPIGLSFYTFKNLAYILDIYKENIEPQRNFFLYGVYSTMFPHMVAGPIVRYQTVLPNLQKRKASLQRLGAGGEMFVLGLCKKVLLGDTLGMLYLNLSQLESRSVLTTWIGIFAFTMELYFDFSGYSDMAIGIAKILGFNFDKNFDYPYISRSVSEFWRRWHISLGSWFRDYIYIPMGGNRVSLGKQIRNILVVWALTGLWHGANLNFVFWGVYYGLLMLLEKFILKKHLDKLPDAICNIYTMLAVMIGWVFFSQTNFISMGKYLGNLIGIGTNSFIDTSSIYYLKTNLILFIICILSCRPNLYKIYKSLTKYNYYIGITFDIILFAICIAYMIFNSYTPFLYVRF